MSSKSQIFIPQTVTWLLRLAAHPQLSDNLSRDAVAFAAWYAAANSLIDWPDEVTTIQTSARAKRLSLDRMLKLLSQMNHNFSGRASSEQAKLLIEGYAVHEWVSAHSREFRILAANKNDSFTRFDDMSDSGRESISPFAARLHQLGRIIGLSELEQDILAFAFLTTASRELAGIFEQLAENRWTAEILWTALFKTDTEKLGKAMRPNSPLRLSGMLMAAGRRVQIARVSEFWIDLIAGGESLFDSLLEPLDNKIGSGRPARLLEDDRILATEILKNANEPGVNLLMYGAASLEKRQLLQDVVGKSGRRAFRVRRFEDPERAVLPSLTFAAFALLAATKEPAVLVIERPADALQTHPSQMLRALFGIEINAEDAPPFDENLLATNPIPAIWLASDIASLPEDTIARFVFHAPLKKADRTEHARLVKLRVKKLRLSKAATADILKLDGVSTAQLESAVKAVRLAGGLSKTDRDAAIVQAIKRSQKALSRDLTEKHKPSVTAYSLDYLNTAGRFTPKDIVKCLKKRPQGSVLLYGPPGTGKTQFAEHLCQQLGIPLIAKTASDLMSKWVGDNEKNIAAAFEEAAAEDGALFLDEADSFLQSREHASAGWEVTRVNELLQKMERFDGIVIMATNLFRDLDAAALRRFTFKIEFLELDVAQRWSMFVGEAGLSETIDTIEPAMRERWQLQLTLMSCLAPGDFATVKRQCMALDKQLSAEEWLDQLQIECVTTHAVCPPGRMNERLTT
jgi:DNA replication protein DnaC